MSDALDPLADPRVIAARSRVAAVERVQERNADPTCEATGDAGAARMVIDGRMDPDGAPWGISAAEIATALDALPEGTTRLDVHINSRGGDAFEGLAILNRLRQADVEVHTHVDGIAASAASAIAMAGRTVTMAPSSTLMIHDASGIALGQAADMRILANALDVVSDAYAAAYAAKAGGDPADWRALMQPEQWYRADEAVKAGLADSVAANPPTRTTATYDLSIFAYAGRDAAPAPKTPAEPPVTPPTDHKESAMDNLEKVLRERLGIAVDAVLDEAALTAELDQALAERADPPTASTTLDAAAIKAALEADGKTVVSKNVLDELTAQAQAGAQARAKQLEEERDATIAKAFSDGKISAERRDSWTASWDKDPEGTKADLESLPARFPVGPAKGHQGDGDGASTEVMSDTQADALAAQFGVSKEALLNG